MFAMLRLAKAAKEAAPMCMANVHGWFRRVFKEQAGGAEIIATIVIIGIVLVLAFIFRDSLFNLVSGLWDNLVGGADDPNAQNAQMPDVDFQRNPATP